MRHDRSSKDTIPHQTSTLLCDVKGCIISSFIHTCYPPIYQFNQSTQKQNVEIDLKKRQAGRQQCKQARQPTRKESQYAKHETAPRCPAISHPVLPLLLTHTHFFFVFSLYLASNQPLPSRKKKLTFPSVMQRHAARPSGSHR